MYSILIRDSKTLKWDYYQSEEGANFAGTLAEAKATLIKLMKQGQAFNNVKVVHNTVINLESLVIADVTE